MSMFYSKANRLKQNIVRKSTNHKANFTGRAMSVALSVIIWSSMLGHV